MKRIALCMLLLLIPGMLMGCNTESTPPGYGDTEPLTFIEQEEIKLMPKNVYQLGESFEYSPGLADGHFLCTVNKVWLVEGAEDCPPKEAFSSDLLAVYPGDSYAEEVTYEYEEWFTPGGAYDQGARIMMAEFTVTNVDAVAWLNNGKLDETTGWFNEDDLFYLSTIFAVADMSKIRGNVQDPYYMSRTAIYSSLYRACFQEDDPSTPGVESGAYRLPPGETVTFVLAFPLHGELNGKAKNISLQWMNVCGDEYVKTGIFIDTGM